MTTPNFSDYISHTAKNVEKELSIIFDQWEKDVKLVNPKLVPLMKEFKISTQGGKRIRAALVVLGFQLVQSHLPKDIYKIGASYEIMQTALLIHDDIIDKSPLRRGIKTVENRFGGDHYGLSQALCLGDAGFFLSMKIFQESCFPIKRKEQAMKLYIQIIHDTHLGQMLDISCMNDKKNSEEKDILDMYYAKTALYSIIGPLQIGAALAGAKIDECKKLQKIGKNIGIAYQLQDDILGFQNDEDTIGKSIKSDYEEGKMTLLYWYCLNNVRTDQLHILNTFYGKKNLTQEEAMRIQEIFFVTKSIEYVQKKVAIYFKQAQTEIENAPFSADNKKLLFDCVDLLMKRIK
jgi:geranylgeranyl diphosphate synthase, type I